jgi:hypothetical protein
MSIDDRMLSGPMLRDYLAKGDRSVRRFLAGRHVSVYLINGRPHVRKSELDAWIESQRLDRSVQQQPNSLKSLLEAISAKALAQRKGAA